MSPHRAETEKTPGVSATWTRPGSATVQPGADQEHSSTVKGCPYWSNPFARELACSFGPSSTRSGLMTSRWSFGGSRSFWASSALRMTTSSLISTSLLAQGLAEAFKDRAVSLLPGVADELRADAVRDGLLDGVGVYQAGQGRGREEGVPNRLGGPFGQGRGPEADKPSGTDLVGDLVVLAERVDDEVGQRRGHARIDLAEVGVLDGVALVEQEDVPVSTARWILAGRLCSLEALGSEPVSARPPIARSCPQSSLMSSQARTSRAAVGDGRRRVGNGEQQARLERPAGCSTFPDEGFDEGLCGRVARLAVEPHDDERQLRPVRNVVRAVGEEAAVEELRTFAEEVLGRLSDAGLDSLGRDRSPPA